MRGAGQQHDEAVEAERDAGAIRQAVFERRQEILVDRISLAVERLLFGLIGEKSAALLLRVGQFAERIGEFEAADIKLEALAEPRVAGLWPRQGGERDGIVVKEGRRADAEMRLDAIEKNPKEQRFPIVARMRRDTYALRRRGEPRRIRASRIGRGGEEVDAAMALERVGDG